MINEQVAIKEFTLTTVIKHYHHLVENVTMISKRVDHLNLPWAIAYVKNENNFSFYLFCLQPRDDKEWSIDAKLELIIISSKGHRNQYAMTLNAEFGNNKDNRLGINDFIPNNVMQNDYLVRNEVVLEIKVQILRMSGIDEKRKLKSFDDDEAKRSSDMTLCVDDRQFHVSKFFLANQSTHFSSIIFEKARTRKFKVTLNDVDPIAFQTYLEVIYLEPTLTDNCVEDVLHLAIKYYSRNVARICEEFLLHSSKLSTKQKIRIGIRFNLENLKKSCIDSLESAADVRAVLGYKGSDDNIKDPQVLQSLIRRSLTFR